MRPRLHPAATAAAALAGALVLCGCELALHEVQQATAPSCDIWQAGCPVAIEYAGCEPLAKARVDPNRREIVGAAAEAPYRPCDTAGLVCQSRIIGDVLYDQYVMVVAGQSQLASTAASGLRLMLAAGTDLRAATAAMPSALQPARAPGRIVRTHGTRAGASATAAPSR